MLASKVIAKCTLPWRGSDDLIVWAKRATKTGIRIVEENNIDVIWATAPKLSNLLLAKNISAKTSVPFVVDFRDLLDPSDTRKSSIIQKREEESVLQACTGFTCVAPQQIIALKNQYSFLATKPSELVYNFYADDEKTETTLEKAQESRTETMIYGGSLYGGQRRIEGVIEALTESNKLNLQFFGKQSDRKIVSDFACRFGVESQVALHDRIGQSEFNRHCFSSAIQLLIVGHGSRHEDTIPGKLYDYFRTCRPILVVGPRGNWAGQMVVEHNRGIAVSDDDVSEIHVAVEKLMYGKNQDEAALDLTLKSTEKFSPDVVVGKLIRFMEKLVLKT